MASRDTIIQQIERTVDGRYEDWQIGLTDDSARRKAEFGNPLCWLQWQAESTADALEIIDYFVTCGMRGVARVVPSGESVFILLVDKSTTA